MGVRQGSRASSTRNLGIIVLNVVLLLWLPRESPTRQLEGFTGGIAFPQSSPRRAVVQKRSRRTQRHSAPAKHSDVLIVGAGVAGLAAAAALKRAGCSCTVLEASDGVGGVARTDMHDGYLLDRGFCVFNEAPAEVKAALDVPALELQPLMPAVRIQQNGQRSVIADPRRVSLEVTWETLCNPLCTLADKVKLVSYVAGLLLRPDVLLGPDEDAERVNVEEHLLQRLQLSHGIVDGMFRPLLQGAYKLPLSMMPRKLCDNLFQNFWQSGDSFPKEGIGAISKQLQNKLPSGCVHLGCKVKEIKTDVNGGEVLLADGDRFCFDAAIIATEGPEAMRLLGQPPDVRPGGAGITLYFSLDEADLPFPEACKLLNGDGTATDGRTVNSLAFPTNIDPSRAPKGRALCGVVIVGEPALPEEDLVQDVRNQLTAWFGSTVASWTYLRSYRTRQALPKRKPEPTPVCVGPRLYICGDHTAVPAIYAALGSGARVAATVCKDLGKPYMK